MPRIATWNVNSVKARLANVLEWLKSASPDIALLQELKCTTENFPRLEIEDLGYNAAVLGQKSYNGVAILAKRPIEDVLEGLPDSDDAPARSIEGTVDGVRVASIYLPNGNPADTEKFPYKLVWMDRLRDRAAALLETEMPVALGGDYNIIPEDEDCYDPAAWKGDALFRPESRGKFRAIEYLGYTEAFRALHSGRGHYTFWDYQAGAWQHDNGIRIDHFLLSAQAADRLEACEIDRTPRAKPKASDHTPVVVTLRDAA